MRVWVARKVVSGQSRNGVGERSDDEYSRGCKEVPFSWGDVHLGTRVTWFC